MHCLDKKQTPRTRVLTIFWYWNSRTFQGPILNRSLQHGQYYSNI